MLRLYDFRPLLFHFKAAPPRSGRVFPGNGHQRRLRNDQFGLFERVALVDGAHRHVVGWNFVRDHDVFNLQDLIDD